MGFHNLNGLAYERAFLQEIEMFQNADQGVRADDVAAALLLRDHGKMELLGRLYRREITTATMVDEDTVLEDLLFQEN